MPAITTNTYNLALPRLPWLLYCRYTVDYSSDGSVLVQADYYYV